MINDRYLLILLIFVSAVSYADIVRLKNGDNIEGRIDAVSDTEIVVKIQYGKVNYPVSDIREIKYDSQVIADNLYKNKNYKEALKLYLKEADSSAFPDLQAQMYYKAGLCLKNIGKPDESCNYFIKVSSEYQKSDYSIKSLYELAENKPDDEAKRIHEDIISRYPDNDLSYNAYDFLAGFFKRKRDYSKALEYYKAISDKFPENRNRQSIIEQVNQLECTIKAPEIYENSLKSFEDIQKLRWSYKNLKLYDPIIENLKLVVDNSSDMELILKCQKIIILCHQNQGEYKKANIESSEFAVILVKYHQNNEITLKQMIDIAEECSAKADHFLSNEIYTKMLGLKLYCPEKGINELVLMLRIQECLEKLKIHDEFIRLSELIINSFDYKKLDTTHKSYYRLALLKLLDYYKLNKKYNLCIKNINAALKKIPFRDFAAECCLVLGLIYLDAEQPSKTKEIYGILMNAYPGNIHADFIKAQISIIDSLEQDKNT